MEHAYYHYGVFVPHNFQPKRIMIASFNTLARAQTFAANEQLKRYEIHSINLLSFEDPGEEWLLKAE